MATGWNVMDALNNKTKAAAEDNKTKARFRTKDIAIKQMYSNDKNFYSIQDIEQLAQDILAVGLLENLTVVHDPCNRGEYRIIAGERRWRALTLLVEKGYEEFSVASCQIKTPAEEHEEMIQLIIANTYRNKTVADILEEQKTLEETLKYMKENGLTLHGYKLDSGRLRDVIANMMQVSSTKIGQIESINKKLIPEFTEELKEGRLTFSAAYEISKMSEDIQEDMLEHHREKGLTYKDVKEYAEEQKKAEEEEQIDGQLSIEDVNAGACQNLTPEENTDQNENVVMLRIPTEEDRECLKLAAREIIKKHKEWFKENMEQLPENEIISTELIKQKLQPEKIVRIWVFEAPDEEIAHISLYSTYIQLYRGKEHKGNFEWFYLAGAIRKMWDIVTAEESEERTEKKEKNEEQEEKSEETEEIETPDTYAVSGLEEEPAEKENEYRYQDKEETQERLPEETQLHEKKSGKTDLDIAREENQKYRNYLEMAKGHMDTNDIRVRTYKVMIAALAGYINDLDTEMNPPKEPEQPELPRLKNNDQRKEWLKNYKAWGLWYTDKNINVNYYKYDFADGSRLVVAEYKNRINGWNGKEKEDEYYFHLLEKDKKPYGDGKPYDKQYMNATDSETYLVEFLKNLQKNA
jgi:ParB-like chromosome segregation protein Spo0J